MALDQIERETTIAAPVERVWALLTEPEHISGWFTDAGAEIDLRSGGALVLRWVEHGTAYARVEAVDPPHRFAYRWTAHHAAEGAEPVDGNSTLVEFTLVPEGSGTRLRVVESGFDALDTTREQAQRNHDDNVGGWAELMQRIPAYAERVAA